MKSRMYSLFALILFLCVGATTADSSQWRGFRHAIGDVDGDGCLSHREPDALLAYVLGGPKPAGTPLFALDVNGDNHIDISDVGALIGIVVARPDPCNPAPEQVSHWYVVGDLNHDQKVDFADFLIGLQYFSGGPTTFEAPLDALDVNEDGRITIADLQALASRVM